jgi:hypothetical protein
MEKLNRNYTSQVVYLENGNQEQQESLSFIQNFDECAVPEF